MTQSSPIGRDKPAMRPEPTTRISLADSIAIDDRSFSGFAVGLKRRGIDCWQPLGYTLKQTKKVTV